MRTAIVSDVVDYPIGDLVTHRVLAMGVTWTFRAPLVESH
jgi:hypothetical protein